MIAPYDRGAVDGASLGARIVAYKGQRMAVLTLSGAIGLPLGFHASQFIHSLTQLRDYDILYAI